MRKFLFVVVILFVIIGVITYNKSSQKFHIRANEGLAIATLKSFSTSQILFQASAMIDTNNNGVGEFGFIQELAGEKGRLIEPQSPLVSSSLMPDKNGIATKAGYHFCVYLPGSEGYKNAISETMTMLPTKNKEAAKLQEKHYIFYAWPVKYEKTGKYTFCITENNKVYSSDIKSTGKNKPSIEAYTPSNSTWKIIDFDK